jgi:NitT/TauT family transport system ATP-binding protein
LQSGCGGGHCENSGHFRATIGRDEDAEFRAVAPRLNLVEPESTSASEAAIRAVGVAKTFAGRNEVHALDNITFDVARGEFVSIIGPSGCGKSTLLRIVAGLIQPDAGGTVEVFGHPQTAPSNDVGVVFQTYNLLPWLTVEANMRLAAEVQGIDAAQIRQRVEAMLPVLKLASFRAAYPHELSGGMRQRTALGQALVRQPQVLLLDEPFAALDALTRDQLNIELLRLWQEIRKTVILVTHSIAEAVFLADRVLVVSDRPGRIIEDLRIDLPRPRDPHGTKGRPEFSRYVLHLGALMGVA